MKPGILVIGHGSRDPGWVSLVDEAVAAARDMLGDGRAEVEAGFLELVEGRLIQDGIDRLEAVGVDRLLALPLFVSSGSTHVDEIGWALGAYAEARTETDLTPFRLSVPLDYGSPLDDDLEVVDVLMERLLALSCDPANESILLIGHGSKVEGFRQAWERGMAALAEKLMERGGFADGGTAQLQLEQVGESVTALRNRRPDNAIIALPLFLSEGYFTKEVIPRKLAGMGCLYDGKTLMPHRRITDWIVRQSEQWLAQTGGS